MAQAKAPRSASKKTATSPARTKTETLYLLSTDDAVMVAEQLGLDLAKIKDWDAFVRSVNRGIDGGLGSCWREVMSMAVQDAYNEFAASV